MTTRLTKMVDGTYETRSDGACVEAVQTFYECFHAAASTLGANYSFVNETGSSPNRPPGAPSAFYIGRRGLLARTQRLNLNFWAGVQSP